MLAVHPKFRDQGIGSELLEGFIDVCASNGADKITLEVRKSSERVIRFYQKRNFQIVEHLEDFYTNGEDAYKMMRVLDG